MQTISARAKDQRWVAVFIEIRIDAGVLGVLVSKTPLLLGVEVPSSARWVLAVEGFTVVMVLYIRPSSGTFDRNFVFVSFYDSWSRLFTRAGRNISFWKCIGLIISLGLVQPPEWMSCARRRTIARKERKLV